MRAIRRGRPGQLRLAAAAFACIALSLTFGCGNSAGADRRETTTADSHEGIPDWELLSDPLLELGRNEGPDGFALAKPWGAVLFDDRVIVLNGVGRGVHAFSLQGDLIGRSGGAGRGPGEYVLPVSIVAVGDTAVAIWDAQLRRITFLDATARPLRTLALDLSGASSLLPQFVGILSSGHFVFQDERGVHALSGERSGERRDPVTVLTLEPDGTWRGVRYRGPGSEVYLDRDGRGWTVSDVLFGRSTRVTIAGGDLVIASTDSLVFQRLDVDGRSAHTASIAWAPTEVTSAHLEAERQRVLQRALDELQAMRRSLPPGAPRSAVPPEETEARRVAALPHRHTFPAFATLVGAPDGSVWVGEHAPAHEATRRWLVLDARFHLVARITIPAQLDVIAVRNDLLLTRSVDAFGVETLGVYRIDRQPYAN